MEKYMKKTRDDYGSRIARPKFGKDAKFKLKESSGTESGEHDTSNRSGNNAHVDDADIRPIYDAEQIAEVNSCAKVPPHKTNNINKLVEQISVAKKPERQIPTYYRFSIKRTYVVHEKTKTPRSRLRWKPMGRIFKNVGLGWVPNGKIFTFSTTKVDGTFINVQEEQNLDLNAGNHFNIKKERITVWIKENVISQRPRVIHFSIHSDDGNPSRAYIKQALRLEEEEEFKGFQDDAKYEHVGQDTRSQDGKDVKYKQEKDLKISD
nr:hypothetical protein [Tanacetum cinerariifolium]